MQTIAESMALCFFFTADHDGDHGDDDNMMVIVPMMISKGGVQKT